MRKDTKFLLLSFSACQQLALAGAVVFWYFRKPTDSPVATAICKLLKYHLGSAAKGSILITLFKIPRLILTYFYAKWVIIRVENSPNHFRREIKFSIFVFRVIDWRRVATRVLNALNVVCKRASVASGFSKSLFDIWITMLILWLVRKLCFCLENWREPFSIPLWINYELSLFSFCFLAIENINFCPAAGVVSCIKISFKNIQLSNLLKSLHHLFSLSIFFCFFLILKGLERFDGK